ncbi:ATP adenylyltransferase [Pluteus cervinus]|uniref:ATP adenylyltransferase n=1 Tax=Pluteus cervinus TaxID=181527 RepID=A0ACD3ASJ4_9AGAR|nr:ATP adenylyltransferase [Pluteus cervinus]
MSSAADLVARLSEAYDKALNSGDLLFFPSTIIKHVELGVDFEIRSCPALLQKAVAETLPASISKTDDGFTEKNPFLPPYNQNLYVGEITPEGADERDGYVLNKFSAVPQHFLLITKEHKSQSSPLLPPDLVTTYQLLIAAKNVGKTYVAFYNCGDASGASQPHKHIQFLPVDDPRGPPIEKLAALVQIESPDKPFALSRLPYANHTYRFPPHFSYSPPDKLEAILATAFLQLLDLVISSVRHAPDAPAGRPSYNVILTLEHLHLIPRARDVYTFPETDKTLSVNSLGFAGYLLVKTDDELEAVKQAGVGNILRGVGFKNVHDLLVAGGEVEAEGLVT